MFANFEAIHTGHHDIENDDVRSKIFGIDQGLSTIECTLDFVTNKTQRGCDEFSDIGLVINDEHPLFFSGHR